MFVLLCLSKIHVLFPFFKQKRRKIQMNQIMQCLSEKLLKRHNEVVFAIYLIVRKKQTSKQQTSKQTLIKFLGDLSSVPPQIFRLMEDNFSQGQSWWEREPCTSIDLSFNKIQSLPSDFEKLSPTLKFLNLCGNEFSTIDSVLFDLIGKSKIIIIFVFFFTICILF